MRCKMRQKIIARVIKGIWNSLNSHLPYTYGDPPFGAEFHRKTVLFYAKQIVLMAQLLNKEDE